MVALPCCYLTLKAHKPHNRAYPRDLLTLGDHIRKRRLDLGLQQKHVAAVVNTTTSTVTNWEKNRTGARLRLLPGVFKFLGYCPLRGSATRLAEKIKRYRIQKWVSLRKLAKELGSDPGTLAMWERNVILPRAALKIRPNGFLDRLL